MPYDPIQGRGQGRGGLFAKMEQNLVSSTGMGVIKRLNNEL